MPSPCPITRRMDKFSPSSSMPSKMDDIEEELQLELMFKSIKVTMDGEPRFNSISLILFHSKKRETITTSLTK